MIRRRFVNIMSQKTRGMNKYTLHRLDVSNHLFYPSPAVADDAASNDRETMSSLAQLQLPPPAIRFKFNRTSLWDTGTLQLAALLRPRTSEDRVLVVNASDRAAAVVYDIDTNTVETLARPNGGAGSLPMTFFVNARPEGDDDGDHLYVMDSGASCFNVLRFASLVPAKPGEHPTGFKGWRWDPLPLPPFDGHVVSHAVVGDGGRTIFVSPDAHSGGGGGTYCFDTVAREWRRAAGDWALPFDGGAVYVPDLNLWLGFSAGSHRLCFWDLSAVEHRPPELKHVAPGFETPQHWAAKRLFLVSLGAGRFCVAKIFDAALDERVKLCDFPPYSNMIDMEEFVVLTGVEVEMVASTSGDGDTSTLEECDNCRPGAGIRVVQHKSVQYKFIEDRIRWVV